MFLCSKDAEFFADSNDYNNLLLLLQNMAVGEQILKLVIFLSADLDIFLYFAKYQVFFLGVYSPDYDNCSYVQYVNKQPRRLSNGDFWVWPRFDPLTPSP